MRTLLRNFSSPVVALAALPLLLLAAGCDSDDNGGEGNTAPSVSVSASPESPSVGTEVTLSSDVSDDTDSDDNLDYSWSLDAPDESDASLSDSDVPSPTFTPDVEGDYTASLSVTDGDGASGSGDVTVSASAGGGNGGSTTNPAAYDTTGTVITVTDEDRDGDDLRDGTGTATWTAGYTYLLNGRVAVNEGDALTIEAGTVVKGASDQPQENASVLVVARGATINADGTASNPIIFTAEEDDVSDPLDLTADTRGLWGGVIILGSAPLNSNPGETAIEGIPADSDPRGLYGGNDPEDDSGTFRYVSIRHAGIAIADDNEINGLTMGGVGRGTTIEYVEVFANQDDGFEWFGGTVDTKYLVSAFCGDDGFDIDEGFVGRGQYFFLLQAPDNAGNGGEHDGGTDPETAEPFATPHIYNATYIGSEATDALALYFRDNFAGSYYNSIFAEFPGAAIEIEDLPEGEGTDTRARFEEETVRLSSNLFYDFGAGDSFEDLVRLTTDDDGNVIDASFRAPLASYLSENNSIVSELPVQGISREPGSGGLNPLAAGPATGAAGDVLDDDSDFIDDVDYIGAFGDENWAAGWTFLSEGGFF